MMKKIKTFNESSESVVDNIYIKSVEIISDVSPLKAGIRIDFNSKVTFIVGDNGVGKSTLLECVRDHFGYEDDTYMRRTGMKKHIKIDTSKNFNFTYIDFHGDDRKYSSSFGNDYSLQLLHMKSSSGQVSMSLLNSNLNDVNKFQNGVVIFDEPCRGQSIKNKWNVIRIIKGLSTNFGCQVIVTTHSDTILSAFKDTAQYFDISKNENTSYKDFIISQMS